MAPVFDAILPHLPVFFVALARIAGLFLFAPALASPAIPARVKAFLALALTFAVYPTIDLQREVPLRFDLAELAPLMASEALIGASIGLLASLPLIALQMGGLLMGQQMGLGLAAFYNPAIDSEADVAGQLLFYMGLGVFMALGGIDLLVHAVVVSFAEVPLGGFGPGHAPLELLVGLLSSGFELAMRVAAPVFCILFLETAATALIMKTAPQLNILSFGFPLRIMLALGVLYASLIPIDAASTEEIESTLEALMLWVHTLGRAGAAGGGG